MPTGYENYDEERLERLKEGYLNEASDWGRPPLWKLLLIYAYRTICVGAWILFLVGIPRVVMDGLNGMDRIEMRIFLVAGAIAIAVSIRGWRRSKRRDHARTEAMVITRELELRKQRERENRGVSL